MRQHFSTEQWLPFPRRVVFAFFGNPQNLPPLMPTWQKARIDEATVVPPPPLPNEATRLPSPLAGSGTTLLITARAAPGLPLRLPWLARIEDFRWNESFCDVQLEGPFAFWRHCHSVQDATREGTIGTTVRDDVEYLLPLWPVSAIGMPAGSLAMKAIFRYRHRQAEKLLPAFSARVTG